MRYVKMYTVFHPKPNQFTNLTNIYFLNCFIARQYPRIHRRKVNTNLNSKQNKKIVETRKRIVEMRVRLIKWRKRGIRMVEDKNLREIIFETLCR
jgi:hypothetical protein